jgi:hypothetical protein
MKNFYERKTRFVCSKKAKNDTTTVALRIGEDVGASLSECEGVDEDDGVDMGEGERLELDLRFGSICSTSIYHGIAKNK